MKLSCPIVDTHASWLALNPIHGCPFSCKYCFMGGIGNTSIKPVVLCNPKEAVNELINYKNYNKNMPLCLFSSTDAFATIDNIKYAKELVLELLNNNIRNPIIFITKCYIPDDFLDLLDQAESKGMKFIFFLSYSGIDSSIERGINHEKTRMNFMNLSKRNKTIIHYWRPFIPQNSTNEKIEEVLSFVKKYAKASVVIGLKVQESFVNNLDFWPEIIERKEEAINSESTWTHNAYQLLYNKKYTDYKIFRSTSCALSYCLEEADYNCYYNTEICKLNNCDMKQKERCGKKININKQDLINIINEYLNKNNKKIEYEIDEETKTIIFNGILSTSETVIIKYLTAYNVISSRDINDHYWNTGHYEEEHLIM